MTMKLRYLAAAMLMVAALAGAALTAHADPTTCTFGCDGANTPRP